MSHLLPCPTCNRHVDTGETACPFCAAALPASFRAAPPPLVPPRRLARAALVAAGTALLGAAACNDPRPVPVPPYGIATGTGGISGSAGVNGAGGAATGGNGATDGATDGVRARDAGEDRSVVALYGAAVPVDTTKDTQS
jgi:hypothetical protein